MSPAATRLAAVIQRVSSGRFDPYTPRIGQRVRARCCSARGSMLSMSRRLVFPLVLVLLLAACAPSRPPGSETASPAGVPSERVRAPAAGTDDSALQVYRLRNTAVIALGRQAAQAAQAGDLERAGGLLERALRLDGRDAEILQQMAELHLVRGDLQQAGVFAERARELGPGVGELCERSLQVLMQVHERDGQYDRAWQAYSKLADCRVTPPDRF